LEMVLFDLMNHQTGGEQPEELQMSSGGEYSQI